MKFLLCIGLSLIVGPADSYANSDRRFRNIHSSVQAGLDVTIGDFTNIGSYCVIGNNARIGSYCNFGSGNKIHDNVYIGDYVTIRENSEIADNSELKDYVALGSNIKVGSNAKVLGYSTVDNFVSIGNGCILESYSSLGSNANIGSLAYCGQYSSIGSQAIIGENAVILRYVKLGTGEHVNNNEVVIRTPTSASLYSNCLPFGSIPQNDVVTMSQYSFTVDVSPEANSFLSRKITNELHRINSNCKNADLSGVALVKSLYLILYHGVHDFNYYSQLRGSGTLNLSEEHHFGSIVKRSVLTPEVTELMIRLLVLEEDARRTSRVTGDTFCKMSADILNNVRLARVDQ